MKDPLSPKTRINRIIRFVSLAMIIQTLLSIGLWWKEQGVIPYNSFFVNNQLSTSSIVFYPVFLLLNFFGFFFRKNKMVIAGIVLISLVLIMGNINRLQVWFYLYLVILVINLFSTESALESISLLIPSVYIWSGLHKLNPYFVSESFHWLTQNYFIGHDYLAYIMAAMECGLGIGLFFSKSRHFAVKGLVTMHLILLLLLGPFGQNWNVVVWYWNITMIFLLSTLYWKRLSISVTKSIPNVLVALVIFFPLLNYNGITPESLSFKMYAGTNPEVIFYFSEKDKNHFKGVKTIYEKISYASVPVHRFNLDNQSFKEYGTPTFQYPYFSRQLGRSLCTSLKDPQNAGLLYYTVIPWDKDSGHFDNWPCNTLLESIKD